MKRWPWVLVVLAMILSFATPLFVHSHRVDAASPGLEAVDAGLEDGENARILATSISDSMDLAMYGMVAQLVYLLMLIVGLVAGVGDLFRYWKNRKQANAQ